MTPPRASHISVVDVGSGLHTVTTPPGGHYMVYDAGTYEDHGASCAKAVRDVVPDGAPIDLFASRREPLRPRAVAFATVATSMAAAMIMATAA